MPWQSMHEGEIHGPMSEDEFLALLPSLAPEAKVYKDGWKEWRKLEDVPKRELPQPPEPEPLDEAQAQPARFLRRAGAFILDYLLIRYLLSWGGWGGDFWQGNNGWSFSWSETSASSFFGPAFWATLVYETLMVSRLGWTLGKFVFGIRVSHQGRKLSLQRSAARVLAKKLNLITLMIGYLMALWDKERLALHDHLCKTRVFLR